VSHATSPPTPRAPDGLRERKRLATHQRIADEAARLATDRGMSGTTIEEIAAAAEIGRATFFRYFDTKEIAIAEGFSTPWLTMMVEALQAQPAELGPVEAVTAAFRHFELVFAEDQETILRQSKLSQSSPGLQAWTLQVFARFEQAIGATLAPRFDDLRPEDPRPRMLGALVMAAIRHAMDRWLAGDARGDLAQFTRDALTCVTVVPPVKPLTPEETAVRPQVAP
jgi:AcrR family transcriptional regulator